MITWIVLGGVITICLISTIYALGYLWGQKDVILWMMVSYQLEHDLSELQNRKRKTISELKEEYRSKQKK